MRHARCVLHYPHVQFFSLSFSHPKHIPFIIIRLHTAPYRINLFATIILGMYTLYTCNISIHLSCAIYSNIEFRSLVFFLYVTWAQNKVLHDSLERMRILIASTSNIAHFLPLQCEIYFQSIRWCWFGINTYYEFSLQISKSNDLYVRGHKIDYWPAHMHSTFDDCFS